MSAPLTVEPVICKYCGNDHVVFSRQMFDGKPYLCIALQQAMPNLKRKILRRDVGKRWLRQWSCHCKYCDSIHHAWPPCPQELDAKKGKGHGRRWAQEYALAAIREIGPDMPYKASDEGKACTGMAGSLDVSYGPRGGIGAVRRTL